MYVPFPKGMRERQEQGVRVLMADWVVWMKERMESSLAVGGGVRSQLIDSGLGIVATGSGSKTVWSSRQVSREE